MPKLLVVEDNALSARILSSLLQSAGYQVELACNGAEALEKARSNPPDMIISDVLMPGMDGFTLCRQWKKINDSAIFPSYSTRRPIPTHATRNSP